MRKRGRINYVTFALTVCVLGVASLIFLVLFNEGSPTDATGQFLNALANGNVDRLMQLSWYDGDRSKLKTEWEFATQVAGKYYAFTWVPITEKDSGDSASVEINLTQDSRKFGAYAQQTAVPLVKKDGKWLVDVKALDRKMYPDLPN